MGEIEDLIEFLFRAKQIQLIQEQIKTQEIAANNAQGTQHIFLEAINSNTKQTLEVVKLTRILTWLTVALVVIGLAQMTLYIIQIAIMKGAF